MSAVTRALDYELGSANIARDAWAAFAARDFAEMKRVNLAAGPISTSDRRMLYALRDSAGSACNRTRLPGSLTIENLGNFDGYVLAGGAVSRATNGHTMAGADHNVFATTGLWPEIIVQLCAHQRTNVTRFRRGMFSFAMGTSIVEVVLSRSSDPFDIIMQFDFAHSQMYYDGTTIYGTVAAWLSYFTGRTFAARARPTRIVKAQSFFRDVHVGERLEEPVSRGIAGQCSITPAMTEFEILAKLSELTFASVTRYGYMLYDRTTRFAGQRVHLDRAERVVTGVKIESDSSVRITCGNEWSATSGIFGMDKLARYFVPWTRLCGVVSVVSMYNQDEVSKTLNFVERVTGPKTAMFALLVGLHRRGMLVEARQIWDMVGRMVREVRERRGR